MPLNVKAAALRFLKIRPRSIAELKEKLEAKGFSASEIETAVHDLIASRLLDDRAFTKSWINYRLARPFGFKRIIQELQAKGVTQDIIDEVKSEFHGQYEPQVVALDLARRRWQRMLDIDPVKKKKRVLDFLLRRGFDVNIAMKVCSFIARSEATKQSL